MIIKWYIYIYSKEAANDSLGHKKYNHECKNSHNLIESFVLDCRLVIYFDMEALNCKLYNLCGTFHQNWPHLKSCLKHYNF